MPDASPRRELTCRELVELATDYVEGALPPRARRRVERHLLECPGCRHHLGQLRRTIELTGRLREEDLPEAVLVALLEAFRGVRRPSRVVSGRRLGGGAHRPSAGGAGGGRQPVI